jgi:four helix bundle protein
VGHFKQLKAWQHAQAVAVLSKAAIARLPVEEANALADQWRRASYSVALNIAEGASRRGSKEFRKHLDIARASLHELEAIMELAVSLEYCRPEDLAKLEATVDECARTVFGLLRKFGDATTPSPPSTLTTTRNSASRN